MATSVLTYLPLLFEVPSALLYARVLHILCRKQSRALWSPQFLTPIISNGIRRRSKLLFRHHRLAVLRGQFHHARRTGLHLRIGIVPFDLALCADCPLRSSRPLRRIFSRLLGQVHGDPLSGTAQDGVESLVSKIFQFWSAKNIVLGLLLQWLVPAGLSVYSALNPVYFNLTDGVWFYVGSTNAVDKVHFSALRGF